MNRLNIEGMPPEQGGAPAVYMPKFDRTAFDYIIIAAGYLFMPLGLVLALLRLISTHYKNYRKASNYNLFFHVFVGGFVEVGVVFLADGFNGNNELAVTIIILVMFAVLLLLPAYFFGRWAVKQRFVFGQLCTLYMNLVMNQGIRNIGILSERSGQSEMDVRRDMLYLKEIRILEPQIVFNEGLSGAAQESAGPNLVHPERTSGFGTMDRLQAAGQPMQFPSPSPSPSQTPQQLPKSVRCTGCGAQNTVHPGQSKSCDYCGTTIPYS